MKTLFVFVCVLTALACSDSEPECISDRIADFKEVQKDCPGASITKYEFQGKTLYGFSDGQCISDGGTSLVDEECNNYCFIGGIAALTDCKGEHFYNNARELDVIWDNSN